MTVDPHTAKHRAEHARPHLLFLLGPLPHEVRGRSRALSGAGAGARRAGERRARSTPARCTRRSARWGPAPARSAAWRWSRSSHRRGHGPNPELVDMTRRFWIALALTRAGGRPGDGRRISPADLTTPHRAASSRTGSSSCWRRRSCCGPAGRSSSAAGSRCVTRNLNMFTLIAMGTGVGVALQRRRRRSRPALFPRPFRGTTARSPSTSRRPRSSPSWCCSARCWSCAPASRPPAPSARCSTSRPRPRAASRRRQPRARSPLDAGRRSATGCACGPARRSRSTARSSRAAARSTSRW